MWRCTWLVSGQGGRVDRVLANKVTVWTLLVRFFFFTRHCGCIHGEQVPSVLENLAWSMLAVSDFKIYKVRRAIKKWQKCVSFGMDVVVHIKNSRFVGHTWLQSSRPQWCEPGCWSRLGGQTRHTPRCHRLQMLPPPGVWTFSASRQKIHPWKWCQQARISILPIVEVEKRWTVHPFQINRYSVSPRSICWAKVEAVTRYKSRTSGCQDAKSFLSSSCLFASSLLVKTQDNSMCQQISHISTCIIVRPCCWHILACSSSDRGASVRVALAGDHHGVLWDWLAKETWSDL